MAELTQLESQLGEILGLAQAAQEATSKVKKLVGDEQMSQQLQQMHDEAAETEQRCMAVAQELDGKKGAVEDQAKETKSEAQQMMETYLGDSSDPLEGLEFLIMAEAGELGHVEILRVFNEKAGNPQVQELVDWVQPIQERHFQTTRQCALSLAGQEDPNETE